MVEPSRRTRLIAASAAIAIGATSIAMIHAHPESLHAPAWVAYVAGSAFVLAGLCLFAGALGVAWLERAFGIAVTASLFAVSLWVAFGPGERACTFSVPGLQGDATEAVCRGAFGLGALMVGAFFGLMLYRMIVRKADG